MKRIDRSKSKSVVGAVYAAPHALPEFVQLAGRKVRLDTLSPALKERIISVLGIVVCVILPGLMAFRS